MTGHGRRPPKFPEDAALWKEVARTVAPLSPGRLLPADPEPPAPVPPKPPQPRAKEVSAPAAKPRDKLASPAPPPLAPLDRRLRGRVGRGAVSIDARTDLHGLTQAVAHRRLISFLTGAQADGAKLVLVITGKGRIGDTPYGEEERGVLKRMVPIWLSAPDLRSVVVGFEAAGRGHGGEGALYVRIRRRKPG